MKTFREIYCSRLGLPPGEYEDSILRRGLYGHARFMRGLLQLADSDYFSTDREFIRGLGEMTSRRELANEVTEFRFHPANNSFFRRTLKLRVSAEKVRRIFEHHVQDLGQPARR